MKVFEFLIMAIYVLLVIGASVYLEYHYGWVGN